MYIEGENSSDSEEDKHNQEEWDKSSNSSALGSIFSDDATHSKLIDPKKLRIRITMSEEKRNLLFPTAKDIFFKK
jgi:hypothetical protein